MKGIITVLFALCSKVFESYANSESISEENYFCMILLLLYYESTVGQILHKLYILV